MSAKNGEEKSGFLQHAFRSHCNVNFSDSHLSSFNRDVWLPFHFEMFAVGLDLFLTPFA